MKANVKRRRGPRFSSQARVKMSTNSEVWHSTGTCASRMIRTASGMADPPLVRSLIVVARTFRKALLLNLPGTAGGTCAACAVTVAAGAERDLETALSELGLSKVASFLAVTAATVKVSLGAWEEIAFTFLFKEGASRRAARKVVGSGAKVALRCEFLLRKSRASLSKNRSRGGMHFSFESRSTSSQIPARPPSKEGDWPTTVKRAAKASKASLQLCWLSSRDSQRRFTSACGKKPRIDKWPKNLTLPIAPIFLTILASSSPSSSKAGAGVRSSRKARRQRSRR
mmetsp:Transcript_83002/g.173774  ORF Transcript_83002/g.173774 Transcript_83002/m.173774 type:complete len:284 (+) Transcript_83002:1088-1939(+)